MVDVQRDLQIDIERGGFRGARRSSAAEDTAHHRQRQLMKLTEGKKPYLIDGYYVAQFTSIKKATDKGVPEKVKFMLLVRVFFDGEAPLVSEFEELKGKKRKAIFKDMYSLRCIHSIKNVPMCDGRTCTLLTFRGPSPCQLTSS